MDEIVSKNLLHMDMSQLSPVLIVVPFMNGPKTNYITLQIF